MKIIITNNPMVQEKLQGQTSSAIEFHDTDYLGVLKAVRDKIHLGYRLLTHPLSGSVKPGETPYKTIIITEEKGALHEYALSIDEKSFSIDEKSLSIIEESIQTCVKLTAKEKKRALSEKILADFQLIDYNLIFGQI